MPRIFGKSPVQQHHSHRQLHQPQMRFIVRDRGPVLRQALFQPSELGVGLRIGRRLEIAEPGEAAGIAEQHPARSLMALRQPARNHMLAGA
ncbi:hypothetical protein NG825_04350 [Xanthomonas sacchari]|nr:hypothetical protein NG825_04350 [Xanthomonas sacchari]